MKIHNLIPVENSHVLSAAIRAHAHIGNPYNIKEAGTPKIHPKVYITLDTDIDENLKDMKLLEIPHPVCKHIHYRVYGGDYRSFVVEEINSETHQKRIYVVYFPGSFTDFLFPSIENFKRRQTCLIWN